LFFARAAGWQIQEFAMKSALQSLKLQMTRHDELANIGHAGSLDHASR